MGHFFLHRRLAWLAWALTAPLPMFSTAGAQLPADSTSIDSTSVPLATPDSTSITPVSAPPAAPDSTSLAPPSLAPATPDTTAVVPVGHEIPDVHVVVNVPDFGRFRIRPFRDEVPNHVSLFLSLVATGVYDGMGFHRIIPGYLIQTGDPTSRDEDPSNDGRSLPTWRVPEEPNNLTHVRGTVSMAWHDDEPGSAGTQWFVTLADVAEVDGHATPIGEVVEGLDVVDRISQVTTLRNRHPLKPVRVESVRLVPGDIPTEVALPAASED